MPWPKGKPRPMETRAKITSANFDRHAETRAHHLADMKKWQAANPGKTAYWKLKGQRNVRVQTLEALGGKCARCGFGDWRALQVDHVNGNGRRDRKRDGNRYAYLKTIKENPEKYQCLCANCNWIKRYEQQEHGAVRALTGTED